jgi:hypothetical protein
MMTIPAYKYIYIYIEQTPYGFTVNMFHRQKHFTDKGSNGDKGENI